MPNNQFPNERTKGGSFFFYFFIFFVLIAVDQTAKHFARGIFANYNFAFSLVLPKWLMYFSYAIILAAMIYYVIKNYQRFAFNAALAWTLIFAGAASNLAERLFMGFVRDFIYVTFYKWTGVYNLADGYIIVGIIILVMQNAKIKVKNDNVKLKIN